MRCVWRQFWNKRLPDQNVLKYLSLNQRYSIKHCTGWMDHFIFLERYAYRQTDRQTDRRTDTLTHWLTHWLTDWLTDRQTDRQTHTHTHTHIINYFLVWSELFSICNTTMKADQLCFTCELVFGRIYVVLNLD